MRNAPNGTRRAKRRRAERDEQSAAAEAARFVKNETMPVFNEAAEEAQPAIRAAARAVREANEEGDVVCPACGSHNDAGAKFCDNCGKQL